MRNLSFETCYLLFEKQILKVRFCQNTIEYTTFMFLANQVLKLYIGGENLDTKLQVLRLPKTFRVAVYNRECTLFKAVNLIMVIRIIRYVPAHGIQS